MKIIIKATNLEITEAIRSYAEDKINALTKYYEEIFDARVELQQSTHHQSGFFRCEVNLDVPQKLVIRAESEGPDLYAAIDEVVPKLREQIEKFKGQTHDKDRRLRRFMKSIFAWRSGWGNKKG